MAKVDVSLPVPLPAETTWGYLSDLSRFDEWLTIHDGWRSEVPAELVEGVRVTSVVRAKGFRNRVDWVLSEYRPPQSVRLTGRGKGGVKLDVLLSVAPDGDGSRVRFVVDLGGRALFGPIGSGVALALKGDIDQSLRNFVGAFAG